MSRPAAVKSAGQGGVVAAAGTVSPRGGTASNVTSRPVSSSSIFVMPATFMGGSLAVGVQFDDAGTSGSGLERCQNSMTGDVRRLSASQRSGALLDREMCETTSELTDSPRNESMPVVG